MTTGRMTVFVSWSGERSLLAATALSNWLKLAVQTVQPWFSGRDIPPGTRWNMLLSESLQNSLFGVFCVTKENRNSPWLLFEAGAVGRYMSAGRVVPVLLDIHQSELDGPLSQFQALEFNQEGIRTLVRSLHEATDSGLTLIEQDELFEILWPHLEKEVAGIREVSEAGPPVGSSEEMLAAILDEVRGLRVAPDERSILTALQSLEALKRGEIVALEEQVESAKEAGKSTQSSEEAIKIAKQHIERLRIASRQIKGNNSYAMSAALVEIVTPADVRKAVKRLGRDLEIREYQYELRGGAGSPAHKQLSDDMVNLEKIEKLMDELGILATESET